ncbi:MAG: sulfatase, partial [Kofleriaceae bacterium]|nr:sulfatase [Kofleriaceae bacterium]
MKRSQSGALTFLVSSLLAMGCGSDKEQPAEGSPKANSVKSSGSKTVKSTPEKPKAPSARDGYQVWRSLLQEASRAELRFGGPFIDLGTADQNKYTQGNWESGWSTSKSDKSDKPAATLSGGKGHLNTYLLNAPKELVIRARSTAGAQSASLSLGSQALGEIKLNGEWQTYRLAIAKEATGRKLIKFTHDKATAMEVDFVWLSDKSGAKVPSIVDHTRPIKIGKGLRRSLLAPGAQTYSYYLHIPEKATLIFDYASQSSQDFIVRVEGVDNKINEVFRGSSEGEWKTAKVDLSAYAGLAVRLEMATEGAGSGGAWGEPGIFVTPTKYSEDTIIKAKKAKNLVMIIMDTTRADQFELFAPGNGIHTPNIDAFSKKATSFTRAYNNGNWTKPSVLSIFSGLYPATHTATKPESMVPEGIELISEHLQKNGMKTQGFSSNPVVSEKFGFERGWDGYEVFYEEPARGKAMYERASKWVEDNGDEPFFMFIQTIDPHTTYAVDKKYWSRYYKKNYTGPIGKTFTRADQKKVNDRVMKASPDDVAWIQALYHGEITYQDEHVGVLLDKLKELGRLEDTIVVVTNDHGEEIYDHRGFGHGWTLYEEMIKAPLMIHYPPLFPKETVVDKIIEHVDLAPTLVEALG